MVAQIDHSYIDDNGEFCSDKTKVMLDRTLTDKNCHKSTYTSLLRQRVMAWHWLFSIFVALSLSAITYFFWFQGLWFELLGGLKLILVVVGVDAVLGPSLMWLLFRPDRKTPLALWSDFLLVVVLQSGALIYGVHVALEARPVFIVFAVDRFEVVHAGEIEEPIPPYEPSMFNGPRYVYLERPPALDDTAWASLMGGQDLSRFPKYYQPYESNLAEILRRTLSLPDLHRRITDAKQKALVGAFIEGEHNVFAVPIVIGDRYMTALVDNHTAQISSIINVDIFDLPKVIDSGGTHTH